MSGVIYILRPDFSIFADQTALGLKFRAARPYVRIADYSPTDRDERVRRAGRHEVEAAS